ncbi:Csu type fimbrial protein [Ramlibacter sp.]|uniref:Csu type fimbrial protein n=1 Tax=Ramlibacter sp. TaxID=1917967 RepID=UPI002FC706A4
MRKPLRSSVALALVSLGSASIAMAGSCSVGSTGMAFGRYQPLTFAGKLASSDRTADATVTLSCIAITTGGSYTITLGPSAQGNSIVPRYLTHDAGGPAMSFNIYTDTTYTSVWGDGFVGAVIGGSIPVGDSSRSHTVFGRVAAGQSQLRVGNYASSLTVRITYNP